MVKMLRKKKSGNRAAVSGTAVAAIPRTMLPIDEIGTVEFPMYAMSATVTVVGRAARTVEATERDGRLRRVVLMLEHTQETFCDDGTSSRACRTNM